MKPRKSQLQHRAAMRQRSELKRKTELKPGKPLERKTPMPRTKFTPKSAGRENRQREVTPRVNGPVKARSESTHIPDPIRQAVLERDAHACKRCGVPLEGKRYSLHHRRRRGAGGSALLHTMANLVSLCGTGTTGCHGHIESNRAESYAIGWLVPNGAVPEEWPVLRNGSWWQPGDEWTAAVPHSRQIEMGAPVGAEGGTP